MRSRMAVVLVLGATLTLALLVGSGYSSPARASGPASLAVPSAVPFPLLPRIGPPGAAPIHRVGRAHHRRGLPIGTSIAQSTNWAGYDATGGGWSTVTSTWTQPSVPPTGLTTSFAAFWVGLDGDGSSTVEQIGTAAYSFLGSVGYYAWYEMYPANSVAINSLTISPGDVMTASVTSDGLGNFTLAMTDTTTGHSYSITKHNGPTAPYSAEVIAEAPTNGSTGQLYPLANFGTVHFTNSTFNGQPISAYNWNRINMVTGTGANVAGTSPLGSGGADFYVSTDFTPPTTTASGADSLWHNQAVNLTFTATDNAGGSGVAYTQYSIDGGATWTTGTSLTIPAPADHSNDGAHTILYRSADNAGNVETAKTVTVKIDTTPPVTADNTAGAWHAVPFTLALAPTDALSGMSGGQAETQYSTDGGATWQTGTSLAFTARWKRAGGSGTYPVLVMSTDAAGNTETPHTVNVMIDTSAPTSSDDASTTPVTGPVTVHLTGRDAYSGVAFIWYSLDGGAWTQVAYPGGTGLSVSISGTGLHTLRYNAVDGVGNLQVGYGVCSVTIT